MTEIDEEPNTIRVRTTKRCRFTWVDDGWSDWEDEKEMAINYRIASKFGLLPSDVDIRTTHRPGPSSMGKTIIQYRVRFFIRNSNNGMTEHWSDWQDVP